MMITTSPPPTTTPLTMIEFRDVVDRIGEETNQDKSADCDKPQENAIQNILAESTTVISQLNTTPTTTTTTQVLSADQDTGSDNDPVPRRTPRLSPYPGVDQILPSLFLCSAAAARVNILEHLRIGLVINLAPELIVDTPLPNPKPIYLRIPVLDKGAVDLKQFFTETADLIEDVRQSGGRTLVHCVAGVSRSAAICIAYLMKHAKMTLKDAFHHVKCARPQIRPNCGFFKQLMAYEVELRGEQTVQMAFVASIGQEVPDVYLEEYRVMEEFYQRHRHRSARKRD